MPPLPKAKEVLAGQIEGRKFDFPFPTPNPTQEKGVRQKTIWKLESGANSSS